MKSTLLFSVFLTIAEIMASSQKPLISVESWGSVNGQPVEKFTLRNRENIEVDVISYGATITSIRVPDKRGNIEDVVLGYDNIEGYLSKSNPYFGATLGRVANRIAKGQFIIDGVEYNVTRNIGENSLHGGLKGWNSKIWSATIQKNSVVMAVLSEDGDQGYPGSVVVSATFKLLDNGELDIKMKGFSTKATPINMANHAYFNLAGNGDSATELYKHEVMIKADRWTVTDSDSIPTGEIRSVDNSPMDLRKLTVLGNVIDKVPGGGYDYNFCITGYNEEKKETKYIAEVVHPETGRYLQVYSNQPGVQFYTANFLPKTSEEGILGKDGNQYFRHGAFCLETQNYPDAVNHDNFPNSILRPGQIYDHHVIYKFGAHS